MINFRSCCKHVRNYWTRINQVSCCQTDFFYALFRTLPIVLPLAAYQNSNFSQTVSDLSINNGYDIFCRCKSTETSNQFKQQKQIYIKLFIRELLISYFSVLLLSSVRLFWMIGPVVSVWFWRCLIFLHHLMLKMALVKSFLFSPLSFLSSSVLSLIFPSILELRNFSTGHPGNEHILEYNDHQWERNKDLRLKFKVPFLASTDFFKAHIGSLNTSLNSFAVTLNWQWISFSRRNFVAMFKPSGWHRSIEILKKC